MRRLLRLGGWLLVALLVGFLALVFLPLLKQGPARPPGRAPPPVAVPPASPPPASPKSARGCDGGREDTAAAEEDARSVDQAQWPLFGRREQGWRIYAPLVQRELATPCPPGTAGFASALSRWRKAQGLPGSGPLDEAAFARMSTRWLLARPFVQALRSGVCPASPPIGALALARPDESYGGKPILALPQALEAYRAMVDRARAEAPEVARDPRLLTIVSGYRGPAEEASRCFDGSCNGLTKARCSAHRTGTALDLYLGAAPNHDPISTADDNRRWQTATPAYRWLAARAPQFGFLPYPFEPWHWEWAGGALRPGEAGRSGPRSGAPARGAESPPSAPPA